MDKSPLKLSVNLYSVDLLPKKLRLSFVRLILVAAILPCIAVLYSATSYIKQQELTKKIDKAKSKQQSLVAERESLKQQLEQHKPTQTLVDELAKAHTKFGLTQDLLAQVGDPEQYQSNSYQTLLEDLAQTADGSTWLTNIEVDGNKINLSGETQTAAAVPAWIKRLSQTTSLADLSFEQLIISRDQNNLLQFHVNSQVQGAQSQQQGEAK